MTYIGPTRAASSPPGARARHAGGAPPTPSTPRRLGALGIGLIMEEAGKGARLVFRYPSSPPSFFLDRGHGAHEDPKGGKACGRRAASSSKSPNTTPATHGRPGAASADAAHQDFHASSSTDLFFDLPARVLAKLFRPKRFLCGQPLTLNVSGTTFCCRAELFDAPPPVEGGGDDSPHHDHRPLVLFSVIVALAPLVPSPADGDLSRSPASRCPSEPSEANENFHQSRSDGAFKTIRKVHRNLARLCRVLVREEHRCRYVSRQCNMLQKIRTDYILSSSCSPTQSAGGDGGESNHAATGGDGNLKKGERAKGNAAKGPPPLSPKPSMTKGTDSGKADADLDDTPLDYPRAQRREHVQNLIEIMLSASSRDVDGPPAAGPSRGGGGDPVGTEQYGNLARELAHAFHCMASLSATPHAFLSRATARDGVVYINRHIAVSLEPVDAPPSEEARRRKQPCRPYHTLLFSNSSPMEVLQGLTDHEHSNDMTTSPSISHSLRRIIPHVQSTKSLHEIGWDAGLAAPHVMDAANLLIQNGICMAVMPVLRKNRYACADGVVPKMSSLALPFWQTFGVRSRRCRFYSGGGARNAITGVPYLFVVVSALTTSAEGSAASPTLGEAADLLSGKEPVADEMA